MSACDLQDLYYLVGGRLRKFRRTRIGHRFGQVNNGLLFRVVRLRRDKRVRSVLVEAEAVTYEVEAAVR